MASPQDSLKNDTASGVGKEIVLMGKPVRH